MSVAFFFIVEYLNFFFTSAFNLLYATWDYSGKMKQQKKKNPMVHFCYTSDGDVNSKAIHFRRKVAGDKKGIAKLTCYKQIEIGFTTSVFYFYPFCVV